MAARITAWFYICCDACPSLSMAYGLPWNGHLWRSSLAVEARGFGMKRAAVVLGIAVMALLAATGCEPKMTITAHNKGGSEASCLDAFHIIGTVTPHDATGAVQLQQTYGGTWKDVSGYGSMADWSNQLYQKATPRRAAVNASTGTYTINYYDPAYNPLHLRVRSNAGGALSPAFYVSREFC